MKNRIRVERAELRITQQHLADVVGVSRQTINAIETGKFVPSTVLALKIAQVFNKSVEQVFNWNQVTEMECSVKNRDLDKREKPVARDRLLLYYRGSYPASRANDLSSFTPDPSVVSMSPINSPFIPADSACFCVSLDNLARPPANRMNVRGSMNLKIAIVTKSPCR